jgi:hypothetical protein
MRYLQNDNQSRSKKVKGFCDTIALEKVQIKISETNDSYQE